MTGWVVLCAAFITAVLGPMLVIWRQNRHELGLLRQENTDQHAEGRTLLSAVHADIQRVHHDLGRVDERTETVVEAVESIKDWVHTHEIRHLVDGIGRDDSSV